MTTIYVAGPVSGLNLLESKKHFERITDKILDAFDPEEVTVLSPMSDGVPSGVIAQPAGYTQNVFTDRAITARCRAMVAKSSFVIADLSRAKSPSMGTACEMAWGYDDPSCMVLTIGRVAGGPMDHAFTNTFTDIFFDDIEGVIEFLLYNI